MPPASPENRFPLPIAGIFQRAAAILGPMNLSNESRTPSYLLMLEISSGCAGGWGAWGATGARQDLAIVLIRAGRSLVNFDHGLRFQRDNVGCRATRFIR